MERMSALMDGELGAVEVDAVLAHVTHDEEEREGWQTYHLIGDALRNTYILSSDLASRVSAKLSAEPTVLAPKPRTTIQKMRTYALSMVASVAAIAVVGWLAFSNNPLAPERPVAQVAGIQSSPASATPVVEYDGNVRSYLLAHQEFSPATEIQGVAPYVRTVSESPSDRTK